MQKYKIKGLYDFIKDHEKEIDEYIKEKYPYVKYFNTQERRLWVLNEEFLSDWAVREGYDLDK